MLWIATIMMETARIESMLNSFNANHVNVHHSHGLSVAFMVLALCCMALESCYRIPEALTATDFESIPYKCVNKGGLKVSSVDTFYIDVDFDNLICSMNGNFFVKDDSLFFADRNINEILQFDSEGIYIGNKIKRGRGPNELTEIEYATRNNDGNVLVMDGSWNFILFDSSWKKQNSRFLNFNQSYRSVKDRFNHPDPNNIDMYEIAYDWSSVRLYDNKAIFQITAEHPKYNGYEGNKRKHFFKNSYIFAKYNLKDSAVEMTGHYSPLYAQKLIPSFSGVLFDIFEDKLIYSFQADSLIYVMDMIDNRNLYSFGIGGKGMNQDYESYRNFKEAERMWRDDDKQYGYYNDLRYEPETGFVYRIYSLGNNTTEGRLQVYKGSNLLGEINMTKNSRYIGNIKGKSYFALPADYENDRFTIVRYTFN